MEFNKEKVGRYVPSKRLLRELGQAVLARADEGIFLDTPHDRPDDYNQYVQDLMQKGCYWPVILGSHKSHPAGFPLIEEADHLARRRLLDDLHAVPLSQ